MARIQNRASLQAANIRTKSQKFRARTTSIPAPTGGWNARDDIANMPESDAVSMVDMFPSTTDVMLRKGYAQWATGIGGVVESIMPYNSPTTSVMFSAAGGAFFDATARGPVGAPVQTGLTNARWQTVNFANAGGNFLIAVNGADNQRLYDGSTWNTITGVSTPAITGVDTADLIHVNAFKRRLWYVQKNSLKAWYLPVDSIAGAAQPFDLRSYADLGGYLVEMATWTIDSGSGADDLAVFITSQGQVIVYRGIDPANDVTWSLAGIWNVGYPIGNRCMMKYGGDLLILTYDGLFPLSALLQSETVDVKSALSDKIRLAMSDAASFYGGNFGWDITLNSKANMLILNVPLGSSGQQQFVMNTLNKSWCQFTGWSASCFMLFNNEPYFGTDGMVCKAWEGFADNVSDITGTALQAFNYFGSRGQEKRFTMMRPLINTNGQPAVLASVNVDYDLALPTTPASFSPGRASLWDVGLWDVSLWGGNAVLSDWQGIMGLGFCAAPALSIAGNGIESHWMATDVTLEAGAVL